MSCRRLPLHASINYMPANGNHSISEIFLIFIRADELPEITTAYFQKSHAGSWRSSITGNYRIPF
ncbi:hypothetical protein HX037_04985 [Ignatzschineria indica]|uniref:hypothetical protein n=1 Tax=Ignatzschineria indica TaxID=472583 RepID=UPI00257921BF|nr:hypothetical protein [Ignatzschineria indica]MDM1545236.1 hypothetical protein [Ignatzschineria indica]